MTMRHSDVAVILRSGGESWRYSTRKWMGMCQGSPNVF